MENCETLNKTASNASGVRPNFQYGNILDQKRYIYALNNVRDKKVLDCACGVGWGSYLMANAGAAKVVGLDISDKAIDTAREYYSNKKILYQVGTPSQVDRNEKFDIITSFETIEHAKSPLSFLLSLRELAHEDTVCFLSTPNSYCTGLYRGKTCNPYHFKEYSKDELLVLFENSGWAVDDYLGQHPIKEESEELELYHEFNLNYWLELERSVKYGLIYTLPKKIYRRLFRSYLTDPALTSDCNPSPVKERFQPVYHFFILRPFKNPVNRTKLK